MRLLCTSHLYPDSGPGNIGTISFSIFKAKQTNCTPFGLYSLVPNSVTTIFGFSLIRRGFTLTTVTKLLRQHRGLQAKICQDTHKVESKNNLTWKHVSIDSQKKNIECLVHICCKFSKTNKTIIIKCHCLDETMSWF